MSEDSIPNPINPIIYFFTLTIIYAFFTIYNINSQESLESINSNTSSIYIMIYIALILGGSYFINLGVSKGLCKNNDVQYSSVFFATILPWLLVFGVIYFLLEIFTDWVRPFSNTIGYAVINYMGLKETLKTLLTSNNSSGENNIASAIIKINQHPETFINEFSINKQEFNKFITKLAGEEIFNTGDINDSKIIELFKLVNIKHEIGKIFWYILAGTLVVSISYNYIINIKCQKTVEETQKDFDKLYEDEEEQDEEVDTS